MNVHLLPNVEQLHLAAADCLADWLLHPTTRNVMVAGGNSPLPVYRIIASRQLELSHLNVFPVDEYVGVPHDHPRTCSNLLRDSVADAWRIPPPRFFPLNPLESGALEAVRAHEQRIRELGGLDVVVLGLGTNGHLGFNEPGSTPDSTARLLHLNSSSIEANRRWFNNEHAPALGATVGLQTILNARHVLLLASGPSKAQAVLAMLRGPISTQCPASLLQSHPDAHIFLDPDAAPAQA